MFISNAQAAVKSFRSTKRLQRGLVAFLLVAWFHLNGACPCGCLEHNYWFRMLGMVGSNWDFPLSDDLNVSADQHDCIHKPRDLALAGEKYQEKKDERTLLASILDISVSGPELPLPASSAERPDTRATSHSAGAQRAVLQVFTL